MKLLTLFTLSLFTSCINLASPQTTVNVLKIQLGSIAPTMQGSKLEKIAEGLAMEAGDVKLPLP